jgi:hypothetical protein
MPVAALGLTLLLLLASGAPAAGDRPADEARWRVEHHVRRAEELARHFDALLHDGCPRFATVAEWRAYVDAEVDQLVLLVAHVEQAWAEAKATGDDEVRRVAKAPRRRLADTRTLVDKWQGCALDHGDAFEVGPILRRIERQVPGRQADIALPR